jgi:glycosyltransferase involved in cell wall biosynthesis
MLRQRGRKFQLACVGDVSFGGAYKDACAQIAEHLRLDVFWLHRVSDAVRSELYRRSRCIVYPSIHREPFGMVAAEAMSYGTPVLVPDIGGITEVVNVGGKSGGLTFRTWDSGHLADQLDRLLRDNDLYARLVADTRAIAENFTIARMTDAVLAHLGVGAPS